MPRSRFRYDRKLKKVVEVAIDREGPAPKPAFPAIGNSVEPYRSPVTGEMVFGGRGRSRDLAANGCIDARDVPDKQQREKMRETAIDRSVNEEIENAARDIANGNA